MKRYISGTVLALALAGASSIALAKGPNPLQGYISVWNNLTEKGANHGRCNAIGILGDALLMNTGSVPVLVPSDLAEDCADIGVELSTDIAEPTVDCSEIPTPAGCPPR